MTAKLYDAVFDVDTNMLFNGLPEDTAKWLEENPSKHALWVHVGTTAQILTASEYLDLSEVTDGILGEKSKTYTDRRG